MEHVSFLYRFFLSSIEAAVEHIRKGSVNDILKGLPPLKVSVKVFIFELNCTNVVHTVRLTFLLIFSLSWYSLAVRI